jgi:ABC-2 type transport system ATP-binding protein
MDEAGYAVETEELVKTYNNICVVDHLNLRIPRGGVFGLLGPNGAGKTTLMKMIAGLVRPTSGRLRIMGQDAGQRTPALKKLVGLIPQDSNLEREFTVEEALRVYGRLFGVKPLDSRVEQIIEMFSLQNMRHKTIRALSGGMMRRVLIARCLVPQPELLLLDEPTVGLDPDVRQSIWEIIASLRNAGKTLVFTTHYMEEAERLCDHIAMFRQGQMVFSDTKAALQQKIGYDAHDLEELFIRLAREGV